MTRDAKRRREAKRPDKKGGNRIRARIGKNNKKRRWRNLDRAVP